MRHDVTAAMFREYCDPWTAGEAMRTLDRQYKGDTGYNPGSQMVQIAGIAYLNKLDHYIKERMRRKIYIRYMDDFYEQIVPVIRRVIDKQKQQVEHMSILKPYSFVLEDEEKESLAELYVVDDDTVIIDGELMANLDKDLDDFFDKLLKEE